MPWAAGLTQWAAVRHANTAETKYGPESAKKQVAVWRKAAFRRHSFADGASLPCEAAVYRLRPRHIPERIQISLWNFTHWCCALPCNRATPPERHAPSESTKTPRRMNSISFILICNIEVVNKKNPTTLWNSDEYCLVWYIREVWKYFHDNYLDCFEIKAHFNATAVSLLQ